ncbi:MAG: trigger factor [Bacteroidetes bacterium]|nr:trigger factor [Bacteroidota bacterium]
MNLTKENTGELTATIRLEISPEDYTEQVNKVIRDYQKKANIPGFRPGHVPSGLIRKMYGKAVLAEEVNKLISDSLNNYIREQKLDLLGNPIPNQEKNSAVNFEAQTSFEFFFDIGFAPDFTLPFGPETEVEDYEILVDDSMIDKYVDETRKRFGTPVKPEESLQPAEASTDAEPQAEGETPAETKAPEVIPAEMTPEFFSKVYPADNIETEEQFRERIRKDASASFTQETDRIFFNKATEILVKNTNFDLPDEFLKRWLLEYNEGKFTQEQIEKDYDSFRESMKWQLIENRIIRENDIKVSDEDIKNYIRTVMLQRVGTEFVDPEMEKKYESIVDAFMQNKEQVQRINDQLYNARMLGLFKTKLNIVKKEVSYDEFIKIASEMHEHDHSHHDHEHDHSHHDHEHEL